jgi:hypothetical protein
MEKKTHRVNTSPVMSVRSLADYMAASETAKRTVVRSSKYRSIARIIQHDDAKLAITDYLSSGTTDPGVLLAKSEYIRNKFADDDFEETMNESNADYLARFAGVVCDLHLPNAEISAGKEYVPLIVSGVRVTFAPPLLLHRLTKTNKTKVGAIMYRYAKNKALPTQTGCFQSAAIRGFLGEVEKEPGVEPDNALCVTIDGYTCTCHVAPTNAISVWNNMKAACATIAERWDNIKPPPGAVL